MEAITKLPPGPGLWVVEAGMGQVAQKRRGANLPSHITQAEPGGPGGSGGTLGTLRPFLGMAWSPLSRGSSRPSLVLLPHKGLWAQAAEHPCNAVKHLNVRSHKATAQQAVFASCSARPRGSGAQPRWGAGLLG